MRFRTFDRRLGLALPGVARLQRVAAALAILLLIGAGSAGATQRLTDPDDQSAALFAGASKVLNTSTDLPSLIEFSAGHQPTVETFVKDFLGTLPISANHSFAELKVESDPLGERHHRLAQMYRGVRVLGGDYVVHEKDGLVRSANGTIVPDLNMDPNPSLSESQALSAALTAFGAARYMWEDPFWVNDLKTRSGNTNATWYPHGELVWAPTTFGAAGLPRFVLAWQFEVHAASPTVSRRYVVDARTGGIVAVLAMESNCTASSVNTIFNGSRNFSTDKFTASDYRLRDDCAAGVIRVRDWNSATLTASPVEIQNTSNTWTTMNERFGATVLWEATQSRSYYQSVFGRNSYDNAGGDTEGYINAVFDCSPPAGCTYVDNASMSFSGMTMKVGLGSSGTLANSWSTLDIIAHEYTHAVTGNSAGLVYMNESGALNESFSDIFGETIENWVTGTNDWLMGDQRTSGAIRSFSNPNAYNDPDTYLGTNWYTGTADAGGVHTNSGVQNFWFYLLTVGGSGTNDNGWNYQVTGIGLAKASAIAYRNLTVYLGPNSTYNDARTGAISAATDLYGANSSEVTAVIRAWRAVGIDPCMITCPSNVVASNDAGVCGANVNYSAPTDNGQCYTVSTSPASGTFFGVGTTSVTATSRSGATCSFNVTVNDTEDPVVSCPSNINVECAANGGTPATDAAIAAFLAAFSATDNCPPAPTKSNDAPSFFPHGTTTVTFTAVDGSLNDASCTADVTVVDTTPPMLTCPADLTIECNSHCDASLGGVPESDAAVVAWLAAFSAVDVCDPDPTLSLPHPACFPLGDTDVTFTATDDDGNSASCTRTVHVVDTTPPTIAVELDRTVLWPPNHKMATITATVEVEDTCDPAPTFELVSIVSNEPDNGLGDGDTPNDIQQADTGTPDTEFRLRSERSGTGSGREYTITYRASDHSGNTADAQVVVSVPHDKSGSAMMAGGIEEDGTGFVPGALTFQVVLRSKLADPVTGEAAFDATQVPNQLALIGNGAGALPPLRAARIDADGDGLNDLVCIYQVAKTQALAAGSLPEDGPIGFHYGTVAGDDYLVPDIFTLGSPVVYAGLDDALEACWTAQTLAGTQNRLAQGAGAVTPDETLAPAPSPSLPAAVTPVRPERTELAAVYPVPMSSSATIEFTLARDERVELAVFDVRGARVRTLRSGTYAAGRYQVAWDGRGDAGLRVPGGVYFVQLRAGQFQGVRKTLVTP